MISNKSVVLSPEVEEEAPRMVEVAEEVVIKVKVVEDQDMTLLMMVSLQLVPLEVNGEISQLLRSDRFLIGILYINCN